MRYITKAELRKQIRQVQKRHPKATYAEALEINRQEQLQLKPSPLTVKTVNVTLQKSGLGLSRGMYMETPTGIVNGKMRYEWGKLLTYAGIGQERSSQYFDGEGFTDKTQRDGLLRAMHYADKHELWDIPPGFYTIGDQVRTCQACGCWFVGRNGAKTCKARCRKRLQRMNEKKAEMSHLIPNTQRGSSNESRLEN